jgi:hypothetical protein
MSLDDPELALHTGTVFAHLTAQIPVGKFQPVLKSAHALKINFLLREPRQQRKHLPASHIRINAHLTGQVSDTRSRRKPICLTIVPKDGRVTGSWPQQVEQNSDRRGFSGAVQPQESQNLAFSDFQVQIVNGL